MKDNFGRRIYIKNICCIALSLFFSLHAMGKDLTMIASFASDEDSSAGTIAEVASEAGTFQTLLAAVEAADLVGALSGKEPLTVFAPTDEAFGKLPEGLVTDLLKPENKSRLIEILTYHVISGQVPLATALELGEAETLQGDTVMIAFKDGRVMVAQAALLNADIKASNGVIHVIDQVLLPPETVMEVRTPAELIDLAIKRGVPLFNHGSPRACAAVYEVTCEALLMHPEIAEASRKDLCKALNKMRAAKSQREKAWILRYALDSVMSSEKSAEKLKR